MRRLVSTLAIALCLVSLPALAADCENPIRSFTVPDGQTGALIRIQWSLGGVIPLSQTLSGSDFEEPVTLSPHQTAFGYVPNQPGENRMTLTVVTSCGTFSREVKYHVQQCNVVAPPIAVDKAAVTPGDIVTASIDLPPGHRVRWTVTGGTASATTGESIQITAGNPGVLRINAFVARGDENSNSCEVRVTRTVTVTPPCGINQPQINPSSNPPLPNEVLTVYIARLGAGETVTFNAQNATIIGTGFSGSIPYVELLAPASGTFSLDVIVTKDGCSRTFTRSFEVTPCNPTATVTAVPGGTCDTGTIRVDFTGTAPFQGYWSDGEYFFTMSNSLERTVTRAGTYTIANFIDTRCNGTVTGQAVVGAGLPVPQFTFSDIAESGFYYGNASCPGLVRTATLDVPIPAGAEVIWSVENGTIVGGQGTATVRFAGSAPGPTPLTAAFRDANGCLSQPHTYPYMTTYGVPQIAVSVEPSAITAGGTAVVKLTRLNNYIWGSDVFSSIGDQIVPLGPDPNDPNTYLYEYRSTRGGGIATITAYANNPCGDETRVTTTLTIEAGAPVQATASVRAMGSTCSEYVVYAEFTGTAPFTGTWSTGQTFYSDWGSAYLYPPGPGTYTITSFSDANGPGTVTGEATFDFVSLPAPEFSFSTYSVCPNGTFTATLASPVPEGATILWTVWGGTILSGEGTPTIQIQAGEFWAQATVQITGAGACSPQAPWQAVNVSASTQQPWFSVYPIEAGTEAEFWVSVDPKTATIDAENSLGDPMTFTPSPYPGYYILRYTSTHGPGDSTIRVFGTTTCGVAFEATQVLQILPPRPTATLTSSPDPLCGANVTVTFTGTPPFTGTWNDGVTFTTNDYTVTRNVNWTQYVYLASFSDGTGQTNGSGWVFAEATLPPYANWQAIPSTVCAGGTVTASVAAPPPGYEIYWYAEGPQARIVSGQGTPEVVIEGVEAGQVIIGAKLRTATGCEGAGSGFMLTVEACPVN